MTYADAKVIVSTGGACRFEVGVPAPNFSRGTVDLVGLGIRLPGHLTVDGLGLLATAEVIFCLEPPAFYSDALASVSTRVVPLNGLFGKYALRDDALREAARQVADAAAERAGVVFALGGHPTVAVAPFLHLAELAGARGLTLRVCPGVSSLDTLFADLGVDPCVDGMQVVRGRSASSLNPRLPAIVVCPGYSVDCAPANRLRELALLARDLVGAYGATAAFLVYTARGDGPPTVRTIAAVDVAAEIAPVRLGSVMLAGPIDRLGARLLDGGR